jgi:adenylosuccinate synthase
MLDGFQVKGKASVVLGGQWGSCGKGAAVAWATSQLGLPFDYVTTNAGVQSGHTSIHDGIKRIAYHLPTAPLINPGSTVYLNAGSVINAVVLEKELRDYGIPDHFYIHPMAAIVTDDCRAAEMKPDSAQTKIASTRKGVGEALARKVLRSGVVAKDHPFTVRFIRRLDLNNRLMNGATVLVEVPQGHGLSLNGKFYPHCTSRDCTVGQALSDAAIHPSFVGPVMLVLRTYPIRVGNIEGGTSGGHYPDQEELSWEQLGVPPEITTVTGRVRRVFTFSQQQLIEAMAHARPSHVFLSHCDYLVAGSRHSIEWYANVIYNTAGALNLPKPTIAFSYGPATSDVRQ